MNPTPTPQGTPRESYDRMTALIQRINPKLAWPLARIAIEEHTERELSTAQARAAAAETALAEAKADAAAWEDHLNRHGDDVSKCHTMIAEQDAELRATQSDLAKAGESVKELEGEPTSSRRLLLASTTIEIVASELSSPGTIRQLKEVAYLLRSRMSFDELERRRAAARPDATSA